MAPNSRGHSIESDVDLLMFGIEHLVLIVTVFLAFALISPDSAEDEDRDTRVKRAIFATVVAGIGLASELMQWSIRIMLRIAGDSADDLGVPRFILVCVLIITAAPAVVGVALAVPKDSSDAVKQVFNGCVGIAVITLVVMFVGELWIIG
jgi:hypothetical protein